jgi:AsmA protein
MGKVPKFILIAIGAVIALVLLVAVCVPLFLNADSFRTRIETTLTKSLGRKVTIGKLDLSIWSGGMVATNSTVADDPAFSTQPFIQADSVKIEVAIVPLIVSREIHIRGFSLVSPKVQLLRAANGTWNYSTIGGAASAAQDADTKQAFPDLTVGHVTVQNGRFTVAMQGAPGAASTPARVYEQVNLEAKNFGFRNSFPFTVSAQLPAGGTVNLSGNAGPINPNDDAATPFSGHLEMKHVDLVAAGFMDAASGVSGTVDGLILDASWNGEQMHVTKLLVDSPHVAVVRSNAPEQPKPADANAEGKTMLDSLSVDVAEIKNGALTLTTKGQAGSANYSQLNAEIKNLTPKTSSPFTASAVLPGGGTFNANGNVGPLNQTNNAATPLDAQVAFKHVALGSAGVLPPDAGIEGMADLQAKVTSNGQTLNATGTTQVAGIKLAKNGRPSAKPVQLDFTVAQNEQAMTGEVKQATFTVGRAAIKLAGTYQASGATTAINLKVSGDSVSIDELQAFLPALGVTLPSGSQLRGGTVTTALAVTGTTADPVISGPVKVNNTQLAGFDLGSKLKTISDLTGGRVGAATGSGTNIRSLSMVIREAGGAIRTDNIALDVTGLGTATGAGSVSAGGALNYNVVLKLTGLVGGASASNGGASAGGLMGLASMIPGGAGGVIGGIAGGILKSGIPVAIGGTTSNPTFSPNLSKMVSGGGSSAGKSTGKQNQTDQLGKALGGLFGR